MNSISIGSNNITKDISKILKLDLDYSESLKIKFNSKENNVSSNKIGIKNNIYSEILQKNISIDLVKQIIEARLEEIIELAVCPNNQVKNLNSNEKLKLILIGSGSKLISNIYEFKNLERLLEITLFDETEFMVCEAGFKYHRSEESFLQQTKEKVRKYGFFENFFNLFSK